jgi:hypothetical protein
MVFASRLIYVPILAFVLCAGCQSRQSSREAAAVPLYAQPPQDKADATVVVVTADWNDVDAAVLIATPKANMALWEWEPAEHEFMKVSRIVYRLQTETEQVMTIEFTREGDEPVPRFESVPPIPITIRAFASPFRDPVRERAILDAVVDRLTALRGVEYRAAE